MIRRLKRLDQSVTIPEPGDDFSAEIPVERIRAYEATAVPEPTHLDTPLHHYEVRAFREPRG